MFAIVIKDLEEYLNNSNQLLEKNVIWFKLLAFKKNVKQMPYILYYKY